MPRARNIKPGFFMNEDLAECDLAARLLFIGLWCLADREGRLEDRPKRIGAFVFPYEQYDIDNLLNQLAERGFIIRYEVDGKKYIQVVNFKKHQNPHVREAASEIPAPETDIQCSESPCESMGQDIDCNDETTEQAENNDDTAPCKHHASTMQAPDEHRTSPADSPLLIPDSGFLILKTDYRNPVQAPAHLTMSARPQRKDGLVRQKTRFCLASNWSALLSSGRNIRVSAPSWMQCAHGKS